MCVCVWYSEDCVRPNNSCYTTGLYWQLPDLRWHIIMCTSKHKLSEKNFLWVTILSATAESHAECSQTHMRARQQLASQWARPTIKHMTKKERDLFTHGVQKEFHQRWVNWQNLPVINISYNLMCFILDFYYLLLSIYYLLKNIFLGLWGYFFIMNTYQQRLYSWWNKIKIINKLK